MSQKHIIFRHIDPPKDLLEEIFNKIDKNSRQRAGAKLFASMLGATSSLGIFVFVFRYAAEVFLESGAYSYLSLLFSDPSFVLSYSNGLALSIIESAPVLEISILFFAVYAFLGSFKYAVENMGNLSLKNRLA
ncbi:MAG TPA: hypothetical protein P5056_03115 [Candidatus Paceibacterota bacterium]|nr:hypothetical protein [Candidatus Paceibacterota bacterium]